MAAIEPLLISVKEASLALGLGIAAVYDLLDDKEIASTYKGRRRLVSVASVREYADRLLTDAGDAA